MVFTFCFLSLILVSVWSLNPVTIFVYLSPFVLLYTVFLFYFDVCSSLYFVSRSPFVIWCVCIVSVFFMVCVHCFSIPCAPTLVSGYCLEFSMILLIPYFQLPPFGSYSCSHTANLTEEHNYKKTEPNSTSMSSLQWTSPSSLPHQWITCFLTSP